MFEPFTDRARRVLELARDEARSLDHAFIGTEHLLLGLIREDEGVAAKALRMLDVSLPAVRERVEDTIGRGGFVPTGTAQLTPRAQKVLEMSVREALRLGHNYVGTEHLLLGIVREDESVAAQVLVSLGAPLERVRQQVIGLLSGFASPSRHGTPVPRAEARAIGTLPRCASCGAQLEGGVAYRVLQVPHGDGGEESGVIDVAFIYCLTCGKAVGHAPHRSIPD